MFHSILAEIAVISDGKNVYFTTFSKDSTCIKEPKKRQKKRYPPPRSPGKIFQKPFFSQNFANFVSLKRKKSALNASLDPPLRKCSNSDVCLAVMYGYTIHVDVSGLES